jgi:hypothetical protein
VKRLRARSLEALAVCAAAGCLVATPSATAFTDPPLRPATPRVECETSGRTIRSSAVARVFRVPVRGGHAYYGCLRETQRVVRLARTRPGVVFLEIPRLTGGYFAAERAHIDSHEAGVTLWDLSTGTHSYWGTGEEDFVAGDIEVTANGAVAWIDEGLDVWKADADGRATIGRAGFRLKQWRTLTRSGERISWRRAGVTHSYVLRGGAADAQGHGP